MPAARINLTNQFLIAMPGMADDTFAGSVVYLCEHTENGALGLVINKPIDINGEEPVRACRVAARVRRPGRAAGVLRRPVQTERGFVLHEPPLDADESPYSSTLSIPAGWR